MPRTGSPTSRSILVIDVDIMRLSSNELTNVLLHGYSEFTVLMNRTIIEATLKYIKSTGRFKRN